MADEARKVASRLQHELSKLSGEFDGLLADAHTNIRTHFRTEEERAYFDRLVAHEDPEKAGYAWAQEKMDKLHYLLWEVAGDELRRTYRPGELPVVFSETGHELNACVRWQGTPIVEIQSGVIADLVLLDCMLMRCFEPCEEAPVRCEQFCLFACEYFGKKVINEPVRVGDAPVLRKALELSVASLKEPWAFCYGQILLDWQVYFVLCHEIAHHVLGHLDGCNWSSRALPSGETYEVADIKHQHERDADAKAMHWCVRTIQMVRPVEPHSRELVYADWVMAAPDLFLQAIQYLEGRCDARPSFTHPPAVERRKAILGGCREELESERDALRLARLGESLFGEAVRSLGKTFESVLSSDGESS